MRQALARVLKTHLASQAIPELTDGQRITTEAGVELTVQYDKERKQMMIKAPGSSAAVVRGPVHGGKAYVYIIDRARPPTSLSCAPP